MKSRISANYVGTTLANNIWSLKRAVDTAFNNFLADTWIANLSTTVTSWDVSKYNSYMASASSNIDAIEAQLDTALADANDVIGMIDDLIDLLWTQKVYIRVSYMFRGSGLVIKIDKKLTVG